MVAAGAWNPAAKPATSSSAINSENARRIISPF
jgi:hypothetical protein